MEGNLGCKVVSSWLGEFGEVSGQVTQVGGEGEGEEGRGSRKRREGEGGREEEAEGGGGRRGEGARGGEGGGEGGGEQGEKEWVGEIESVGVLGTGTCANLGRPSGRGEEGTGLKANLGISCKGVGFGSDG